MKPNARLCYATANPSYKELYLPTYQTKSCLKAMAEWGEGSRGWYQLLPSSHVFKSRSGLATLNKCKPKSSEIS